MYSTRQANVDNAGTQTTHRSISVTVLGGQGFPTVLNLLFISNTNLQYSIAGIQTTPGVVDAKASTRDVVSL